MMTINDTDLESFLNRLSGNAEDIVTLLNGTKYSRGLTLIMFDILEMLYNREPLVFEVFHDMSEGRMPPPFFAKYIATKPDRYAVFIDENSQLKPFVRDVLQSSCRPAGNGEGIVLTCPIQLSSHEDVEAIHQCQKKQAESLHRFVERIIMEKGLDNLGIDGR